jgi:hypothetical protein
MLRIVAGESACPIFLDTVREPDGLRRRDVILDDVAQDLGRAFIDSESHFIFSRHGLALPSQEC